MNKTFQEPHLKSSTCVENKFAVFFEANALTNIDLARRIAPMLNQSTLPRIGVVGICSHLCLVVLSCLYPQHVLGKDKWESRAIQNGGASAMVADTSGNVWVGSGYGVRKLDESTSTSYLTTNSGLGDDDVRGIAIDSQGVKWFVSKGGGASSFNENAPPPSAEEALTSGHDQNGNEWFVFSTGGIIKSDKPNWTVYNSNYFDAAPTDIFCIAVDLKGVVLIGTDSGVGKFDGAQWTTFNTSNSGLANDYIFTIYNDPQNNTWFGTNSGVSKFDGAKWITYNTANSGLVNNRVRSIAADRNGHLWIGTDGGVNKFDGTKWTAYTKANSGLVDDGVRSVAVDAQDIKWFGTYSSGVSKFDGSNWTTYNTANSGLNNDRIRSIAIDAKGNKWFGTTNSVSILWETNSLSVTESPAGKP